MEVQKQNLDKAIEVENTRQVMLFNQAVIDQRYGYRIIKRIFDIIASLVGLILLSPLFLVLAILIKTDDSLDRFLVSQFNVYNEKSLKRIHRGFKGLQDTLEASFI